MCLFNRIKLLAKAKANLKASNRKHEKMRATTLKLVRLNFLSKHLKNQHQTLKSKSEKLLASQKR